MEKKKPRVGDYVIGCAGFVDRTGVFIQDNHDGSVIVETKTGIRKCERASVEVIEDEKLHQEELEFAQKIRRRLRAEARIEVWNYQMVTALNGLRQEIEFHTKLSKAIKEICSEFFHPDLVILRQTTTTAKNKDWDEIATGLIKPPFIK
jgi:hypothetical protein